ALLGKIALPLLASPCAALLLTPVLRGRTRPGKQSPGGFDSGRLRRLTLTPSVFRRPERSPAKPGVVEGPESLAATDCACVEVQAATVSAGVVMLSAPQVSVTVGA